MSLKRITAPSALAVSLADAKAHLKVDHADEDALITLMINAATESAEQAVGRAIMPQAWQLTLDAFPEAFELTRTPVTGITSVQYTDTDGTLQTLASSAYSLDNASDHSYHYLVPAYSTSWPDTREQVNAVAVQFTCGYASAEDVPPGIKSWLLLQVGAMYENRQAEGKAQTYALGFADRLLDRYKVWG